MFPLCSQNLGEEINGKGYECPGSEVNPQKCKKEP